MQASNGLTSTLALALNLTLTLTLTQSPTPNPNPDRRPPSVQASNGTVVQVACTEMLYKIFERC